MELTRQMLDSKDFGAFLFFERGPGFADRITHMQRFVQAGDNLQVPVFVYWPLNDNCNDHYLSYFEEINNVSFVDEAIAGLLGCHERKISDEQVIENSVMWLHPTQCYSFLKLREKYVVKVKEFVAQHDIENAIGFHVRKTDLFLKEQRHGITLKHEHFHQIATHTEKRIFLATDSQDAHDEYVGKYGEKIVFYNKHFNTELLRQTPLETAIMELFILAHCAELHGTMQDNGKLASAYSRMAKRLGMSRMQNGLPGFNTVNRTRNNKFLGFVRTWLS